MNFNLKNKGDVFSQSIACTLTVFFIVFILVIFIIQQNQISQFNYRINLIETLIFLNGIVMFADYFSLFSFNIILKIKR